MKLHSAQICIMEPKADLQKNMRPCNLYSIFKINLKSKNLDPPLNIALIKDSETVFISAIRLL